MKKYDGTIKGSLIQTDYVIFGCKPVKAPLNSYFNAGRVMCQEGCLAFEVLRRGKLFYRAFQSVEDCAQFVEDYNGGNL